MEIGYIITIVFAALLVGIKIAEIVKAQKAKKTTSADDSDSVSED